MVEIIGVKFKEMGKVYYFDPKGKKIDIGTMVIVETSRGLECATVSVANKEIPKDSVVAPLKEVVRIATQSDLDTLEKIKQDEKDAMEICQQKIEKHNLDMKLVDVEYTFDKTKLIFYFTSDGRVDFRELVKDLASVFKTRIELRQIGVRDEAKMLGGLGICGRPFCCSEFLSDFQPVSIKMAKEQGLSLNPTKISGTCGRLMCCLKYEQDAYEDLIRTTPKQGAVVMTNEGKGVVTDVSLLRGKLTVRLEGEDPVVKTFLKGEVKVIKNQSPRKAEKQNEEDNSLE